MSWAKVDDKLHAHPKAARAGLEALGLHLLAMSHVAAYETNGHVEATFPNQKAGERAGTLVDRLVSSGLWEVNGYDGDGWIIHDWLKYNPSRVQAKRLAKQRQAAGKRGGEKTAIT
jgi:hypothetical protein